MKVFCCLLASQRCKVVPAFMHFSAFVFFLQKWNILEYVVLFVKKGLRIVICFVAFLQEATVVWNFLILFSLWSKKQPKTKSNFFPSNQQVKKGTKCCLFQAGEMLLQPFHSFAINKKKQRKPLFTIFSSKTTSFVSKLGKASLTHKWNAYF